MDDLSKIRYIACDSLGLKLMMGFDHVDNTRLIRTEVTIAFIHHVHTCINSQHFFIFFSMDDIFLNLSPVLNINEIELGYSLSIICHNFLFCLFNKHADKF